MVEIKIEEEVNENYFISGYVGDNLNERKVQLVHVGYREDSNSAVLRLGFRDLHTIEIMMNESLMVNYPFSPAAYVGTALDELKERMVGMDQDVKREILRRLPEKAIGLLEKALASLCA